MQFTRLARAVAATAVMAATMAAGTTAHAAQEAGPAAVKSSTIQPRWVNAGPAEDPTIIIYADFGTNHNVRLWRERLSGGRYKVWAEQIDRSFYGHFHFWGPRLNVNSIEQKWWEDEETPPYYGRGSGTVCVETWEKNLSTGRYASIGPPCLPT